GALTLLVACPAVADEPMPGEILDKSTWQKAEGLMPPEILKHYREGGYANKIVDWPEEKYDMAPDFKAGSEANEGKFTTNAAGTIIEKSTGQQPPYVIGHPFPTIDPGNPNAGVEIVWDHFYRTWYFGNLHAESQINWMSPTEL